MTNTITANNLKPSSMIFLSIQHVLVMYAGAVSIPLIVGGALGLSTANCFLNYCRSICLWHCHPSFKLLVLKMLGIRFPIMMENTLLQ